LPFDDDDLFFIFISSSSFLMVAPRATVACSASPTLTTGLRIQEKSSQTKPQAIWNQREL